MLRTLLNVRLAHFNSSFKNSFGKGREKSSVAKKILFLILILYVAVVMFGAMGFMLAGIGQTMFAVGLTDVFFSVVGLLSVSIGLLTCIFTSKTVLFDSKDNEMLLAMPIKPSMILASRVLSLQLLEIAYTLLVMLPAIVVYIIYGNVTSMGIVMIILGSVLLGLLTVSIASLVGWIIAYITSKIPFKNLISTVLMIGFMGVYLYLCMNLNDSMMLLLTEGLSSMSMTIAPIYYFGAAVAGDMSAFGMLVLWTVIPFVLMYLLLSKFFFSITGNGKNERHIAYKKKELKVSSATGTMMKKELKRIGSMSTYILNTCMGAVFQVILLVMLVINRDVILSESALYSDLAEILPYLLIVGAAMCATMNTTTAPSLSLEGESLWILKSTPIKPLDVYKGKIAAGLLISMVPLTAVIIAIAILFPLTPIQLLWLVLLPILLQVFVCVFGMTTNIMMPKFDWVNAARVIKQSGSVTLCMFGSMAIVALPIVLYLLVFSSMISLDIYLGICCVLLAALIGACWVYIKSIGVRKFQQM